MQVILWLLLIAVVVLFIIVGELEHRLNQLEWKLDNPQMSVYNYVQQNEEAKAIAEKIAERNKEALNHLGGIYRGE